MRWRPVWKICSRPASRWSGAPLHERQSQPTATTNYKAVKVRAGETAVMPFGPPYKPTVTGDFYQDGQAGKQLSLGMSLVGSAGEVCTSLMVNGTQPGKPAFTITDPDGKVVQSGNFEYG